MSRRGAAALLAGLLLLCAGAGRAEARPCGIFKLAFNGYESGAVAYLSQAQPSNPQNVRTGYCPLSDQQVLTVPSNARRLFFVVNNRAETVGLADLAIVKIYRRRNPALAGRPALLLERVGDWSNLPCGRQRSEERYSGEWPDNSPRDYWTAAQWKWPPASRRPPCNALDLWLGEAFGDSGLSLARRAQFLRAAPARVAGSADQWTLDLYARSYRTSNRLGDSFPEFEISRGPDDEIMVQVWTQRSARTTQFHIPPSLRQR